MINDIELRRRLLDELEWDPVVDATHVGVTAASGAVTLSGYVGSYAELFAARKAARRIEGVKAVADDIEVRLASRHKRNDTDIAESIVSVMNSNIAQSGSELDAEVRDGKVTLHGAVNWQAQRRSIERQVAHVPGVVSIANHIKLHASTAPDDIKEQIEKALSRNAKFDASNVTVNVVDYIVSLGGTAKTLYERGLIEACAWGCPGVLGVVDDIKVVVVNNDTLQSAG